MHLWGGYTHQIRVDARAARASVAKRVDRASILVVRRTVCFSIALFAAACVPSEDAASTADSGAKPEPAQAAPGPPQANQRRVGAPRLNPNRPQRTLPSGNPFRREAPPPADGAPAPAPAAATDAGASDGTPAAVAKAAPAAPPDSAITAAYYDNFDRAELGPEWNPTSPEWKIQGNQLCGRNARNHPVWLNRKLPTNARIEFDAMSSSADGDLKVEIWGDGKSFAKGTSYNDATSYLAIFGGWKNQFHVLARLDEHAPGRPEVKVNPSGADLRARPVKPGQRYHFKVERTDGKTVRWLIDDIEVISFTDSSPLKGDGHEHMGFNDWEVPVCFDNLQITPLAGG
jgi:hypothetical protein